MSFQAARRIVCDDPGVSPSIHIESSRLLIISQARDDRFDDALSLSGVFNRNRDDTSLLGRIVISSREQGVPDTAGRGTRSRIAEGGQFGAAKLGFEFTDAIDYMALEVCDGGRRRGVGCFEP
ncbi:MAG: hypothetical protein WBX19_22700 [Terracidiphilus sp.]